MERRRASARLSTMKTSAAASIWLIAMLALTACDSEGQKAPATAHSGPLASQTPVTPPTTGTVVGMLRMVGGPSGAKPRPTGATIAVFHRRTSSGNLAGKVAEVRALSQRGGRFDVKLSPGSYYFVPVTKNGSPQASPRMVKVVRGSVTRVVLSIYVP